MIQYLIGILAMLLVFGSTVPYLINVVRNKTEQHPVSWMLWTFIGLALLLTYNGAGADKENILPVLATFINPLVILTIITVRRIGKGEVHAKHPLQQLQNIWKELTWDAKTSLALGVLSIVLLIIAREQSALSQAALYVALFADVFAAAPTLLMLWRDPGADKPGAWAIFAFGYFLSLFAITIPTAANYSLPIYMIIMYGAIAVVPAMYLVRNRINPITQWQEWI